MSAAQVESGLHAGLAVLKLNGELRHPLAEAIERAGERLLADGSARQLLLDLSAASFMDSTIIGLLVSLARDAEQRGLPRPGLSSSHPEIRGLLRNLRLDLAFHLLYALPFAGIALQPDQANDDAESPLQQAQLVLKAHRALIDADPANAEQFGELVRMLESEIAAMPGSAPSA